MASARIALLSVGDDTCLFHIGKSLADMDFQLVATAGAAAALRNKGLTVKDVSDITGVPEMLSGRLKALHPAILGGILARNTPSDQEEMQKQNFDYIKVVVCNLKPFVRSVAQSNASDPLAIENIDVEGITLLRAAAKNHQRVTVICKDSDHTKVLSEIQQNGDTSLETRKFLAVRAFSHIATYEEAICDYFRKQYSSGISQLNLRYGVNPHQVPAQIFTELEKLPVRVLNGTPGFINMCDALNGWQLVRELNKALDLPAAASFKHVSPVGAAVGDRMTTEESKLCMVYDLHDSLTPIAKAYTRARSADRLSSIGDFVALSVKCDVVTAVIISREVSNGVIAPGYSVGALEVLKKKSGFCILEMDPNYEPTSLERRTIFGVTLEQPRNDIEVKLPDFRNIVTTRQELPESAVRDFVVATITLKYTQSNSVCYARGGQVIGLCAGQPSRLQSTRLAGQQVDNWRLRQHPRVTNMKFKTGVKRDEMYYAIDSFVNGTVGREMPLNRLKYMLDEVPPLLTEPEKKEWISQFRGVALCSDNEFSTADNIRRAYWSGVSYIAAPMTLENNAEVIAVCDEYNITMVHTNVRLFHH